jgi:hypothetical protein
MCLRKGSIATRATSPARCPRYVLCIAQYSNGEGRRGAIIGDASRDRGAPAAARCARTCGESEGVGHVARQAVRWLRRSGAPCDGALQPDRNFGAILRRALRACSEHPEAIAASQPKRIDGLSMMTISTAGNASDAKKRQQAAMHSLCAGWSIRIRRFRGAPDEPAMLKPYCSRITSPVHVMPLDQGTA